MKLVTNADGVSVPVSNEEGKILNMLSDSNDRLYKDQLEPREHTLANSLVSRGVMNRAKDKSRQYYTKF